MPLVNREKIISLVANRKLSDSQIKLSDIEAAEFKFIRPALKEDLYEQILDIWSATPDFTTGLVDTSSLITAYTSGLQVKKGTDTAKNITAITIAEEAVLTVATHGYNTNDIVYIIGAMGNEDWDKIFQYNHFRVTKVDTNTFKLTSNLVNDYLKAPLAFYTVYLAFNKIYAEISDRGVQILNSEQSQPADAKIRNDIREDLLRVADALMGKALDYIQEQNYSEYEGLEDDEEEYLSRVAIAGRKSKETHV